MQRSHHVVEKRQPAGDHELARARRKHRNDRGKVPLEIRPGDAAPFRIAWRATSCDQDTRPPSRQRTSAARRQLNEGDGRVRLDFGLADLVERRELLIVRAAYAHVRRRHPASRRSRKLRRREAAKAVHSAEHNTQNLRNVLEARVRTCL